MRNCVSFTLLIALTLVPSFLECAKEEAYVAVQIGRKTIFLPYKPEYEWDYYAFGRSRNSRRRYRGKQRSVVMKVPPRPQYSTTPPKPKAEPDFIQRGINEGGPDPFGEDNGPEDRVRRKDEQGQEKQEGEGQQGRRLAQSTLGGSFIPEPADSAAEHGSPCNPTTALEWDFCEQASYPNKAKMICATEELSKEQAGTCICKFVKIREDRTEHGKKVFVTRWVQMKYDSEKKVCLSPEGGKKDTSNPKSIEVLTSTEPSTAICYDKMPSLNNSTANNAPIYIRDLDKANAQCDNTVKRPNGNLTCSRPHPRRFTSFNENHFYCLSKKDSIPDHHDASKSGAKKESMILNLLMTLMVLYFSTLL